MINGNKRQAGKEARAAKVGKKATRLNPRNKGNSSVRANTSHTRGMRETVGRPMSAGEAVTAYGEIFALEDALQVAQYDLKLGAVSTDSAYPKINQWQYYLGVNLWYLLILDLRRSDDPHGRAARTLISLIRQIGLVATIAQCCDAAQLIVQEKPTPDRVRFLITDDMRVTLQSLRFLKRFTVMKADKLEAAGLKNWLSVEKQISHFNRRNYILNTQYAYVMERIKSVLGEWLEGYKPCAVDDELPRVPSGATFEKRSEGGSLNLSERLNQYVRRAHNGKRFVFACSDPKWQTPIPPRPKEEVVYDVDVYREQSVEHSFTDARGVVRGRGTAYGKAHLTVNVRRFKLPVRRRNRWIQVPKNYKTYRVVCPESPINQMMQRKIRDHIWDCLPTWVQAHLPLRNQCVMESLAAVAFRMGLSTTDLSHASDSFSVRVFVDAFPAKVVRDVLDWRPTHTVLPNSTEDHLLQQLSTMGTGNVWLLMAVFLLAAMVVSCEIGRVADERRNGCFAFGDDLIHPDEIRDILYWVLGLTGFQVNTDKSYSAPSRYRESCGSEWWLEADGSVTSLRTLYYPRFPVAISGKLANWTWDYDITIDQHKPVDGLARLISLQHALYWCAPSAAEFIYRAVKRLMPSMTVSLAGTACDDLWGEVESGPIRECSELVGEPAPTVTYVPVPGDPSRRFAIGRDSSRASNWRTPNWFDPELNTEVPVTTRVGHMWLTIDRADDQVDAIRAEWTYLQFLQDGPSPVEDPWFPHGATKRLLLTDPTKLTVKWKVKF